MSSEPLATSQPERIADKKIAIYIVAQDAVRSLAGVLDRIPAPVRERVSEIFVCDAGSQDDTYLVGVGYKAVSGYENLNIVRANGTGVGASNKDAIDYCRERGYDILVLLHADGKYAPEAIDALLAPLVDENADAVFGSRFLEGSPLNAGMPVHKYLGIRLLSALQNRLLHLQLSEHHCGYRAYSVPAIAELPYRLDSDELHFDTELTMQMRLRNLRITEVPVPAYTAEETRSTRGLAYALNVIRSMVQYWLQTRGLREYPKFAIAEKYTYKRAPEASHQKILGLLDRDRQLLLDVGCGAGYLAEALAVRGNRVVGVDVREVEGVRERTETFLDVDLDTTPIPWTGERFGCIVLADVLEHVKEPAGLLEQCHRLLAEDGTLIVSVPNVAHWSVRGSLLMGRFTYRPRGILDRSHLRFFTLATITAELTAAGFTIDRVETTTVPLETIFTGTALQGLRRLVAVFQRLFASAWREMFAYQFIIRCDKNPRP